MIIGKKFLHYAKYGHFAREKIKDKCRESMTLDEIHSVMEDDFGVRLTEEEKKIDLFFRMGEEIDGK